jgi:hypothetical protein
MIDYSKYPPNWLSEIRPYILKRDKYTCQHCGKKHNQIYYDFDLERPVRVVLQVAHLDHDSKNWKVKMNRLKSLCGKCHLIYDKHDNLLKSINSLRKISRREKEQIDQSVILKESKVKDYDYFLNRINKHNRKHPIIKD